jgi:hypothetical protein
MEFEWDSDKAAANLGAESESSTRARRPARNENNMNLQPSGDAMRPEYDFSGGMRGTHAKAYRAGTNVVFLDPDVAAVFTDSAAVNQALRQLVKLAKAHVSRTSRPDKPLQPTSRSRRKAKSPPRSRTARG